MPQASERKKIAILGGGMAALTAAFELTRTPGWQQHYEVTVYQQGWRLGGKCASSRNPQESYRSEEHGFHVFMGFYKNAFQLLDACYQELQTLERSWIAREITTGNLPELTDSALKWALQEVLSSTDKAFEPRDRINFLEQVEGAERIWTWEFKPRRGRPPGGRDFRHKLLSDHLGQQFVPQEQSEPQRLMDLLLEGEVEIPRLHQKSSQGWLEQSLTELLAPSLVNNLEQRLLAHEERLLLLYTLLPALDSLDLEGTRPERLIERVLEQEREERWSGAGLKLLPRGDDAGRRERIRTYLALTIALGLARERLYRKEADLSPLDDRDFQDWLREHGAKQEVVDSALVKAGYHLTFSGPGELAAGAALKGALNMLDYQEHLYFKMRAGMGEVVFTPLYLVLKHRGVKFEFFHSVESLHPSEDGQAVGAIQLARQAVPLGEYRPLIHVDGLPCWPVAPLYEQLGNGAQLGTERPDFEAPRLGEQGQEQWRPVVTRTLRRGEDFDAVVLGISVKALRTLCEPLRAKAPRLLEMIDQSVTVPTHAAQLWLSRALDEGAPGWPRKAGVLACCPEPFDTWADCSQIIEPEGWTAEQAPQSLVYLCGRLPPLKEVSTEATESPLNGWLSKVQHHVWPAPFKESTQVDGGISTYEDIRVSSYYRKSTHPSDQYVLTPPGKTRYRLKADESGLSNLFLAGDWVKTELNTGCVEAAVMAGLQAAQAASARLQGQEEMKPQGGPVPSQPGYIEVPGNSLWPGPYFQGQNRLLSLFLKADPEKLQALCDNCFNQPHMQKGFRYRPLGGLVILQCARIMDSKSERWRQAGTMKELELGFTIPVVGEGGDADGALSLFAPYLFVDSGPAVTVGREVYGFSKHVAEIRMPESWDEPADFSVRTLVVRQPGDRATLETVLALQQRAAGGGVRPFNPASTAEQSFESSRAGLSDALAYIFKAVRPHVSPPEHMRSEVSTMVFLKQFPAVEDQSRACYQAIVEAPFSPGQFRGGWVLNAEEFKLQLSSYSSLKLAETLGLPAEPVPFLVTLLDLDTTLDEGKVVWSSTGG